MALCAASKPRHIVRMRIRKKVTSIEIYPIVVKHRIYATGN
jgi:hypothetical protein